MSRQTLVDSLDLLQGLGVHEVTYIGGDPTVNPVLEDAIGLAKMREIESTVVTNGRAFARKDYAERMISAGLRILTVSIEGIIPECHDAITQRPGSFEETVAGIKKALELGLHVSTSTTVSMATLLEVKDIARHLAALGVKTLGFNIVTPDVANPSYEDGFSLQLLVSKLREMVALEEELGVSVYISASVPECMVEDKGIVNDHFNGKCFVFQGNGLAIDVDGSLIPCVHWIDAPIDSIYASDGRAKSPEEFLKGWNEGTPAEFRRQLRSHLASTSCNTCSRNATCCGGCPLQRLGRSLEEEINDALSRA